MVFESRALEKLCSIVPNTQYAVAVSGGVDSIVLMRLVAKVRTCGSPGVPVVLTVNHGFRPEAENEVLFVRAQASLLGLECKILSWNNHTPKKTQEAARAIRYQLIEEWCVENSIKFLLTAHSKNDQAETVLMRLERGSGIDGLAGMRERSLLGSITILRPLLEFTRKEIQDYAHQERQPWIEDNSNKNPKYKRTFYRRFISEAGNPDILISRLCVTSEHMRRALHCMLHYVQSAVDVCLEFSPWGCVIIKTQELFKVHEEVARRLLLFILMTMGNKTVKPRYKNFSAAFAKIWSDEDFSPFTMHGCKVLKSQDGNITIVREVRHIATKTYVVIPSTIHWDGRFELAFSNVVEEDSCPKSSIAGGVLKAEDITPCGKSENGSVVSDRDITLYVTPLGTKPLPEYMKHLCREVACGLPVLVQGDKVLAYPMQNNDTYRIPGFSIARILLRDRVVSLICTQLDL
ncbi:tRNA lysidine(34) synthetase TilS [Candidatus Anaplasma sp. TIGMIC]|uniref:tRNA lysidine(34) synthetase TilS n=1 Tax=Candidatus Anaplasma sp. TIGMIC TaxID=3020713 RepID=UPI00232B1C14|nr:tRNA lysidine(34) synthetase TilS [Candidatus Anaplasma sp. TIGMIC]MDB1135299.1 tRNA lysidine(34) synthetase TilS [Candidatus Anaplasma sp. TIGMIC]